MNNDEFDIDFQGDGMSTMADKPSSGLGNLSGALGGGKGQIGQMAMKYVINTGIESAKKFFDAQVDRPGNYARGQYPVMAGGGIVPDMDNMMDMVPINAEGQEMIETPQGEVSELKGPSHEQMDNFNPNLQVPEGTKVYSKRIKGVDGKSMAKRKKARESKVNTIKSAMKKRVDNALTNALARTEQLNEIEDQQDLSIQKEVNEITNLEQEIKAYGTDKKGVYAGGTGPDGVNGLTDEEVTSFNLEDFLKNKKANVNPRFGILGHATAGKQDNQFVGPPVPEDYKNNTQQITLDDPSFLNDFSDLNSGSSNMSDKPKKSKTGITNNQLGYAGQIFGTVAPLATTLVQRAGDRRNINFHKEFGKNALADNLSSMAFAKTIQDNKKQDIRLRENTNNKLSRGTSINTSRAMRHLNDNQAAGQERRASSEYANRMTQLFAQRSQLQNQRDRITMDAEDRRDLRDRQDRDNHYTQLNKDLTNLGGQIQQMAKNKNKETYNKNAIKAMNNMSQYFGYTRDKKGNITLTGKGVLASASDDVKAEVKSAIETINNKKSSVSKKKESFKIIESIIDNDNNALENDTDAQHFELMDDFPTFDNVQTQAYG